MVRSGTKARLSTCLAQYLRRCPAAPCRSYARVEGMEDLGKLPGVAALVKCLDQACDGVGLDPLRATMNPFLLA